jgi:hypothetical protein
MSFSSDTKISISLKKLLGKAHTSNGREFFNEDIASGVEVKLSNVIGETLPSSPSSTSLYDITDDVVEFVRFQVDQVIGADTVDGQHGFKLKLPADYEASSSNPLAGSGYFVDNQEINLSLGKLQLISPTSGIPYEAKPFYGGTDIKNSGTQIPVLDARDWSLDYFNGIFFQQDPPADANENPDFVEGYLYIGKFGHEVTVPSASFAFTSSNVAADDVTLGDAPASFSTTVGDITLSGSNIIASGSIVYLPEQNLELHGGESNNTVLSASNNGFVFKSNINSSEINLLELGGPGVHYSSFYSNVFADGFGIKNSAHIVTGALGTLVLSSSATSGDSDIILGSDGISHGSETQSKVTFSVKESPYFELYRSHETDGSNLNNTLVLSSSNPDGLSYRGFKLKGTVNSNPVDILTIADNNQYFQINDVLTTFTNRLTASFITASNYVSSSNYVFKNLEAADYYATSSISSSLINVTGTLYWNHENGSQEKILSGTIQPTSLCSLFETDSNGDLMPAMILDGDTGVMAIDFSFDPDSDNLIPFGTNYTTTSRDDAVDRYLEIDNDGDITPKV